VDYSDALEDEGHNLGEAARRGELPDVWFRDRLVGEVLRSIEAKRSVLLIGSPGAGKTAIIHAVAKELSKRPTDLVEFGANQVLQGTRYLGEWQTKASHVAEVAKDTGLVLYLPDVWTLHLVGRSSNTDNNVLELWRPLIERGDLVLIGEVTPSSLASMQREPKFASLFAHIHVSSLSADESREVIQRSAPELSDRALNTLISVTRRFMPQRCAPGPALQLMDRVRSHLQQHALTDPTSSVIEQVFATYSGLPLFVVSPQEAKPAREIRAWFEDRIVGQRAAIDAVVETIALYKAGLDDPGRPIGSFLFVGPTGVGKTEMARALSRFLFGSDKRMLRFDMSEFKDYHAFEQLIGSPNGRRPAALVDPVRSQPFQLVLLDELEKAHPNVWDLLLQLLDEGRLSPPSGEAVSFRNTIVICTSNVGAAAADRPSVGFGGAIDPAAKSQAIRTALEKQFRPEFLNRFQHIIVFHSLTSDQVKTIAEQELKRVLARDGITQRNLIVDVDPTVLDEVIERGYDAKYGARALKREIQNRVVLPLAMRLMEHPAEEGQILRVANKKGRICVSAIDTAETRAARGATTPLRVEQEVVTPTSVSERLANARRDIGLVAAAVDEPHLITTQERLSEMRRDPAFWTDPQAAARDLRDLDRLNAVLDRIDRLRAFANEVADRMQTADTRANVSGAASALFRLERSVEHAYRELVVMGWDGSWDALVEIAPVGGPSHFALPMLIDAYRGWADRQKRRLEWLHAPIELDEPAMLLIGGRYAYGLMAGEHGLHRFKKKKDTEVLRVQVVAWTDAMTSPQFGRHRALKTRSRFGTVVKSRVETSSGLVLQNEKVLAENRDLADNVEASWVARRPVPDDIVRRYDLEPSKIRDVATGFTSGRPDAMSAKALHELLCLRVDQ
jgi:ATP-dependent Clp protease ATP-binding subunit ClpC